MMITDKPTPEELDTFLKGLSREDLVELIVRRAHSNDTVPIEFIAKSNGTRCGIDNDGYNLAVKEQQRRSEEFFKELPGSVIREHHRALGMAFSETPTPDGDVTSPLIGVIKDSHDVNPLTLLRDHDEITFGGKNGVIDKPYQLKMRPPVVLGLGIDFPFTVVQEDQFSAREHARRLSSSPARQLSSTERFEKFVKDLPLNELFEICDMIVDDLHRRALGDYRSLSLNQSEVVYHTDLQLIYGEIKSRVKRMSAVSSETNPGR